MKHNSNNNDDDDDDDDNLFSIPEIHQSGYTIPWYFQDQNQVSFKHLCTCYCNKDRAVHYMLTATDLIQGSLQLQGGHKIWKWHVSVALPQAILR